MSNLNLVLWETLYATALKCLLTSAARTSDKQYTARRYLMFVLHYCRTNQQRELVSTPPLLTTLTSSKLSNNISIQTGTETKMIV